MSDFSNTNATVRFGKHYNHIVANDGSFLAEVKPFKSQEANNAALTEGRNLQVSENASPEVSEWVDFQKKQNEGLYKTYYSA